MDVGTQISRPDLLLEMVFAASKGKLSVAIYDDEGTGHHRDEINDVVIALVRQSLASFSGDEIVSAVLGESDA